MARGVRRQPSSRRRKSWQFAPLVGAISVEVDLHDGSLKHHLYDRSLEPNSEDDIDERTGKGKLARWTEKELRLLLDFTGANEVTVIPRGARCYTAATF